MDINKNPKKYHRIKNLLSFLDIILQGSILLIITLSGFSLFLKNQVSGVFENFYLVVAGYIFLLATIFYFITLPISFFENYYLEHQYNLSNQKITSWFKDSLKETIIGLLILLICGEFVYFILRNFSEIWWIFAGFFWIFISVVLAKITPTLLIPLFYKYIPLEKEELKDKILKLFNTRKVKIKDVYVIKFSEKTKKANAMVCGFSKNRRVILTDTLINSFSDEEIEQVVAHELGHYCGRDITKLLFLNSVCCFLAFFVADKVISTTALRFGFSGLDDIAFFPILLLSLVGVAFLLLPFRNCFSRFLEKRADLFSLQLTKNSPAFISAMNKLGSLNLADFKPSILVEIFLYNHPPIGKRIKYAKEFKI